MIHSRTSSRRRYAQHLAGYDTLGTGTKAVLSIGRIAGLSLRGWHEGQRIPVRTIVAAVVGRRAEQIGASGVGLTYVGVGGRYKGQSEPSTKVELIWTGEARERSLALFYKNIRKLAERVAFDLAQREIYVEWTGPRRHGRVDRATPVGAPSSGREDAFCTWVRRFSRSARMNPRDACFVERKRG